MMLPSFPDTRAAAECSGVGCEYFSVIIRVQYESISALVGGSLSAPSGSSTGLPNERIAGEAESSVLRAGAVGESRRPVDARGVER